MCLNKFWKVSIIWIPTFNLNNKSIVKHFVTSINAMPINSDINLESFISIHDTLKNSCPCLNVTIH